jgi:hypothetical protein
MVVISSLIAMTAIVYAIYIHVKLRDLYKEVARFYLNTANTFKAVDTTFKQIDDNFQKVQELQQQLAAEVHMKSPNRVEVEPGLGISYTVGKS